MATASRAVAAAGALLVMATAAAASRVASLSGSPQGGWTHASAVERPAPQWDGGARRRRAPAVSAASVLALRVAVYGEEPEYAPEGNVTAALWDHTAAENACVACEVARSSFGQLQLARRGSRVGTVHIGETASKAERAALPLLDECMTWEIAALALSAASQQLGVDAHRDFDYAMLFLPRAANCSFYGRAVVGCDSAPCVSWYRVLSPVTLLHELGHNLGLEHSGVDPDDDEGGEEDGGDRTPYGDPTTAMGHTDAIVGFNAAQKLQLGWLGPGALWKGALPAEAGSSASLVLRDWRAAPGPHTGSHAAVVDRARGGSYVVSFSTAVAGRGPTVYVHYRVEANGPAWLVASLEAGGTFHGHGLSVTADRVFASSSSDVVTAYAWVSLKRATASSAGGGGGGAGSSNATGDAAQSLQDAMSPFECGAGRVTGDAWCALEPATTLCAGATVGYAAAAARCAAFGAGARLCHAHEVATLPVAECPASDRSGTSTGDRTAWTGASCGAGAHAAARVGLGQQPSCASDASAAAVALCCRGGTTTTPAPTTQSMDEDTVARGVSGGSGGGGGGHGPMMMGIGAAGIVCAVVGFMALFWRVRDARADRRGTINRPLFDEAGEPLDMVAIRMSLASVGKVASKASMVPLPRRGTIKLVETMRKSLAQIPLAGRPSGVNLDWDEFDKADARARLSADNAAAAAAAGASATAAGSHAGAAATDPVVPSLGAGGNRLRVRVTSSALSRASSSSGASGRAGGNVASRVGSEPMRSDKTDNKSSGC